MKTFVCVIFLVIVPASVFCLPAGNRGGGADASSKPSFYDVLYRKCAALVDDIVADTQADCIGAADAFVDNLKTECQADFDPHTETNVKWCDVTFDKMEGDFAALCEDDNDCTQVVNAVLGSYRGQCVADVTVSGKAVLVDCLKDADRFREKKAAGCEANSKTAAKEMKEALCLYTAREARDEGVANAERIKKDLKKRAEEEVDMRRATVRDAQAKVAKMKFIPFLLSLLAMFVAVAISLACLCTCCCCNVCCKSKK